MKYSSLIRRFLSISITSTTLFLALATPIYPIYLEVVKALSIPLGIVLGGYFGKHIMNDYKNKSK